jgi:hypothetical protein
MLLTVGLKLARVVRDSHPIQWQLHMFQRALKQKVTVVCPSARSRGLERITGRKLELPRPIDTRPAQAHNAVGRTA